LYGTSCRSDGDDSEQTKRWEEFLQIVMIRIRRPVDVSSKPWRYWRGGEESDVIERGQEEQMDLSKDVVNRLEAAHTDDMMMKPCVAKRKNRGEQWGPVLVERQRRKQNDGVTMLQKAMKLKEKKNLDSLEGNSFASLHFEIKMMHLMLKILLIN
jgi:hypothetical protein